MRLGYSSRTAIGVDLGRRTIKAAQLTASGGRLLALSLLPRPEMEKDLCREDALALKEVLRRQGFKGNRIVIAAPEKAILPAALELPAKVSGAPIEQIIRMELSRLHNIPPDSFEMAYWDLKAANGARPVTHTLAVACPHEAADALLDVFEDVGFHVAALDVRGAAAARACTPLVLAAPQVTAIVDLGWRSTSLLFVCGPSLIYERSLDAAPVADLAAKLAEVFSISLESATQVLGTIGPSAREPTGQFDRASLEAVCKHLRTHFDKLLDGLKVPLSYAKHQFPGDGVQRMLLVGGGAVVPELASYFEARLGFEVRLADPAGLIDSPPPLLAKASNPAMTVAVGLAKFGEACRCMT
jgi:type IV pilus assembly protein PilM